MPEMCIFNLPQYCKFHGNVLLVNLLTNTRNEKQYPTSHRHSEAAKQKTHRILFLQTRKSRRSASACSHKQCGPLLHSLTAVQYSSTDSYYSDHSVNHANGSQQQQ